MKNGQRDFIGDFKKSTINEILNKLGVIRNGYQDEFETIGLERHSNTEDWIA